MRPFPYARTHYSTLARKKSQGQLTKLQDANKDLIPQVHLLDPSIRTNPFINLPTEFLINPEEGRKVHRFRHRYHGGYKPNDDFELLRAEDEGLDFDDL